MKNFSFGIVVAVLIGLAVWLSWNYVKAPVLDESTNEEEIKSAEMERKQYVIENNWEISNPHPDLIQVDSPRLAEKINSPLQISGKARGNWYFEATFPVVLVDWDGRIIAESYATADGDWMTENYVPFTATLEFDSPKMENAPWSERGTVILHNSNASGLPENDKAVEITIRFE